MEALAETQCEKALTLVRQGLFSKALAAFEIAEEACLKENNISWLNFTRHEKMHNLIQLGRYQDAIKLAKEIEKDYLKAGNYKSTVLLVTNVAECYFLENNFYQSLEWLQIAKILAETEKLSEIQTHVYSNLAKVWMELKHFYLAFDILNKAQASCKKGSAEWVWCVEHAGVCAGKLFKYKLAERNLAQAYQYYNKRNMFEQALHSSQALEHLYKEQNHPTKAQFWQQQSISISQQSLSKTF